jgi:hypothetical protein
MAIEREPSQMGLFVPSLMDAALSQPAAAAAIPAEEELPQVDEGEVRCESDPVGEGIEASPPTATVREVRAVRSLVYNRLVLDVIQRRIEKAEAIVRSYLITQDGGSTRIGPYLVDMDEAEQIEVVKVEDDDGWRQLNIPEVEEALAE